MQVELHQPEDLTQLRQQRRQQRDAKQRDRYRAILLALEGHKAPAIARTLGRSRGFVQRWVYPYRDHGLDGHRPPATDGPAPELAGDERGVFQGAFSGRAHRGGRGGHAARQRGPAPSPQGIRGRVHAARRL